MPSQKILTLSATPISFTARKMLAESGGLQGLMAKFSQAGMGDVFQKWVSTGPNPPISADSATSAILPIATPSIDDLCAAGRLLSMVDMGLVDQRYDEEFDNGLEGME